METSAARRLAHVARDRSARLLDQPCGTTRKLVCPYHQWTYNHDGSLVGAPRMPEGFDKSEFPLRRLHTADGIPYEVLEPKESLHRQIAYADNFSFRRGEPWTH